MHGVVPKTRRRVYAWVMADGGRRAAFATPTGGGPTPRTSTVTVYIDCHLILEAYKLMLRVSLLHESTTSRLCYFYCRTLTQLGTREGS